MRITRRFLILRANCWIMSKQPAFLMIKVFIQQKIEIYKRTCLILLLLVKMISTKEQSTISLITSQNIYAIRTLLDANHITEDELLSAILRISERGDKVLVVNDAAFLIELTNTLEKAGCFEDAKYKSVTDFLLRRLVCVGKTHADSVQQYVTKLIDNGASISWFYVSFMHYDSFLYYVERTGTIFSADVLLEFCSIYSKSDNVTYAIDNISLLGTKCELDRLCEISGQLILHHENLFGRFVQKISSHPDIDVIIFFAHCKSLQWEEVAVYEKGFDIYDSLLMLQKIYFIDAADDNDKIVQEICPECAHDDCDKIAQTIHDIATLLKSNRNTRDARSYYDNVMEKVAILSKYIRC